MGTLYGLLFLATTPGSVLVKGRLWEPLHALNDVVGEHCHAERLYVLEQVVCILLQKTERCSCNVA